MVEFSAKKISKSFKPEIAEAEPIVIMLIASIVSHWTLNSLIILVDTIVHLCWLVVINAAATDLARVPVKAALLLCVEDSARWADENVVSWPGTHMIDIAPVGVVVH